MTESKRAFMAQMYIPPAALLGAMHVVNATLIGMALVVAVELLKR